MPSIQTDSRKLKCSHSVIETLKVFKLTMLIQWFEDKDNHKMNYFLPDPSQEAEMRASANITEKLQKELKDVFTGIGCFHCRLKLAAIHIKCH